MIYRLKISCVLSTFPGQLIEIPEFQAIIEKQFLSLCLN